jgi:hypothetical protein
VLKRRASASSLQLPQAVSRLGSYPSLSKPPRDRLVCIVSADGRRSALQTLLPLRPLLVPLLVDHACERVFPPTRNRVCGSDHARQDYTGWLSKPDSRGQEGHGGTVVHGRAGDVEGECRDGRVHQDAEVVAEVGTGDAERPHRGQDECVSHQEERDGGVFYEGREEGGVRGLVGEGFVVAA